MEIIQKNIKRIEYEKAGTLKLERISIWRPGFYSCGGRRG